MKKESFIRYTDFMYKDIEEVKKFCDERAEFGREGAVRDPNDTLGFKNFFMETVLQKAIYSSINFGEEDSVLDLGCGTGMFTETLSKRVRRVYGADISNSMLQLAQQVDIPKALFCQFDGMSLPLKSDSFDYVISRELVHLLNDDVLLGLFKEAQRVLKPEGLYVCIEFTSFNERRQQRVQVRERMERHPDRMIELMGDCGLECVDHYPVRRGRSILQYLIRYGAFSKERVAKFAEKEIALMKPKKNYTTKYNADWMYTFRKSS